MIRFIRETGAVNAAPGAYALWLRLGAPLTATAGGIAVTLESGDYLYCGSAKGPGGLRARLARHRRKDKRAHWHVDQLTLQGQVLGAFIVEGGDECALNAALSALPIPLLGFGSSDCSRCAAHLRLWPKGAALPSDWENARKAAESPPPD
ncbi:MAG: DUF123 domain-containing protein [Methylocystis sp.]|uniref:GIY-YIG nuclease family protein n=1 Tax=Methylocystis sp. TaxID=1911079 RepID=UPI0039451810